VSPVVIGYLKRLFPRFSIIRDPEGFIEQQEGRFQCNMFLLRDQDITNPNT